MARTHTPPPPVAADKAQGRVATVAWLCLAPQLAVGRGPGFHSLEEGLIRDAGYTNRQAWIVSKLMLSSQQSACLTSGKCIQNKNLAGMEKGGFREASRSKFGETG